MAIDAETFRHILGHYPTGVCIVTAHTEVGPVGMTVGSFTSISLDPALVGFFPGMGSSTWPLIEPVGRFCVNVLSEEQHPLCRRFSAKAGDRFSGLEMSTSPGGQPIIAGASAWIDCDLHSVQALGDHYLVVGEVQAMDVGDTVRPLLFFRGGLARMAAETVD